MNMSRVTDLQPADSQHNQSLFLKFKQTNSSFMPNSGTNDFSTLFTPKGGNLKIDTVARNNQLKSAISQNMTIRDSVIEKLNANAAIKDTIIEKL